MLGKVYYCQHKFSEYNSNAAIVFLRPKLVCCLSKKTMRCKFKMTVKYCINEKPETNYYAL